MFFIHFGACIWRNNYLLDFLLVLCVCLIFGLEFNIINYLWFSGIGLFFYFLRSLIGWLPIFVGIQLGFYFYLYGLELQYFFSVFSKLFYVGLLLNLNMIRSEFFFCLGYLFVSFTLVNYLLIRGIYFLSFILLGQYFYSLILSAVYLLVFHEFSFFSLIIGFPLALVFFVKFSSLYLRCYFIACLFLVPIVFSMQIRNLPLSEEIVFSLVLLFLFI